MTAQPTTVHQFHFSVREADAVTNHMRLIQSALAEIGIGGKILAAESKAFPKGTERFDPRRAWSCDLFLIHHSHGNPQLDAVLAVEIPKVLVYHNVTPPEFFRHDPYIADLCRLARRQLAVLKKHVVAAWADSAFNAAELSEAGFKHPTVFPLLDLGDPLPRPAYPRDATQLLFVGRLCPHKNQALLIKALFYLNELMDAAPSLILVGSQDPIYKDYLTLLARGLGVEKQVRFAGTVAEARLGELYSTSSAFVCASLHEGFCIPLVEAMRASLPIIAVSTEGTKGTLGDAGVQVSTLKPNEMAEAIARTLLHPRLVPNILASQNVRLQQLSRIHNRKRIQTLCRALIRRNGRNAYPNFTTSSSEPHRRSTVAEV